MRVVPPPRAQKERLESIGRLDKVGRSAFFPALLCLPLRCKAHASTSDPQVAILAEALPFLQRYHGKTVVIKYGGAAMKARRRR